MTRNMVNFVVDSATAVMALGLVLTGLVMAFVLPPGTGRMESWGLGRHEWGDVHFWLAMAALGLVVIHLALHWSWVCCMVERLVTRGRKSGTPRLANVYGGVVLALLVAGLAGFVYVARGSVSEGAGQVGRPAVNGSITLAGAAALTGRSTQQVKESLELPATTRDEMRLREVAEAKAWGMPEIRRRIEQ